jgi:hypothetical protein
MATRSHIGVKQLDGTINYIYCHWDGYPEHHGPILTNHYNNIDKVNQLLDLGDLSVLKEETDGCEAYGRDKGEIDTEKQNAAFTELLEKDYVDYLYIFDGDYWECYHIHTDCAINLYKTQQNQVG